MVAIELPLDIYDHFVGCAIPKARQPRPEKRHHHPATQGRIAEISCQPDEAKTLLATATKVCPNAVPFIERALAS